MTVDEYVAKRIPPELHPVVEAVRSLVREAAPGTEEVVSYDMPCFRGRKIFAWIHPGKQDITFGFARGTQLNDSHGLLKGTARAGGRHVRLKTEADIDHAALKDYIIQAAELDSR